jgi:integrase/recombinase XerD
MLSIYTKAKNGAGKWRSQKVIEGRGIRTGILKGPFFLRPVVRGKQTEHRLHALTFADARDEANHYEEALIAESKGLTVAELDTMENAHRIPIRSVVDTYLELKKNKAKKTRMQYRLALNEFIEALTEKRIRFLDAITVDVLRHYMNFLIQRGHAAKTVDTRVNIVYFMLKKNGVEVRIPKDELPAVETEDAVPYTQNELTKLFGKMNPEEAIRYRFFLGTACRSQEVTFAAWQDIDFSKKTYHVRRKDDVGFTPKSHESRTVPIPAPLVVMLEARRKRMPKSRWIFGGEEGAPGNHFLRKLKAIALRAGLNCGECKTTITKGEGDSRRLVEVSCKDHPVCEHFYLHRFRKTCATRWTEAGIPVRTIQKWLGHKSLETTMNYLGVTDSDALRSQIDEAYAGGN